MAERKLLPFRERCRALAKKCRLSDQSLLKRSKANLVLSMLLAILVADQTVDPLGPPPPVLTPDSIKAAREKFDLEGKQDTKRPWDGMDLTGPHALEKKRQPPFEKRENTGQGTQGER